MTLGNADFNKLFSRSKKEYLIKQEYINPVDTNNTLGIIANNIINNSTVLDVGCSYGYLGEWLIKNKNCTVYGIDFNSEAVESVKKQNLYKDVFLLDLDNIEKFQDEYKRFLQLNSIFDYIIWADVLEHLTNPSIPLIFISAKLKDKGVMLVSIPNIANVDIISNLFIDRFNYSEIGLLDNTHLRFFTRESFLQWIDSINKQGNIDYNFICNEIGTTTYISNFVNTLMEKCPLTYTLLFKNYPNLNILQYIFSISKVHNSAKTELSRYDTKKEGYFFAVEEQVFNDKKQIQELTNKTQQLITENESINMHLRQAITAKEDILNQLNQTRDTLNNQLTSVMLDNDSLQGELKLMQVSIDKIHSSDFWKMASLYYRLRDKSIVLRSIHAILKWLKRKLRILIQHFRVYFNNYGINGKPTTDSTQSVIQVLEKGNKLPETEVFAENFVPDIIFYANKLGANKYDVFFFPMIDFSFRYQRPQQLASYFAKNGHRVFYLNITQFLPLDAKEPVKIKEIKNNLFEVFLKCPIALDIYAGKLPPYILDIIYSSLNALRKQLGLITTVSLIHNPFWTPLAFKMKKEHNWIIIYDCMDEWNTFSGIGKNVLEQESQLVKMADVLTVTAALLYHKWESLKPSCTIVRNACDYGHFIKAASNHLLSKIKRPIIGFMGGIADWFDVKMIYYAATCKKEWSFVLLGGIFTNISSIENLPNIYIWGNKPYVDMPSYLFDFDVCLIPFKKNKITEAVDPVKLYEYFSLGKPVVARALSEIQQYKDYLYLYDNPEEFVNCIELALSENNPDLKEARKKIARTHTWGERVDRINDKLTKRYGKASIIIVTYNNIDYTKLCVDSILSKTDFPSYEIIIVDNNSNDDTRDYVKSLKEKYDLVKIILNEENKGFAKANNQGIQIAEGNYVIFLNNDTVVTHGWLTKMINYLDNNPDIGLIGPVTNFCGNEARIEPDYQNLIEMDPFATQRWRLYEGKSFDIKMLALFCAATRRDVLEKVGLLDEKFGIGMFEDDDFSHRMKINGYKVVCAEDIFIHHFGQVAFKNLINNGAYNKIFTENKEYFEKKWGIQWSPHTFKNGEKISEKTYSSMCEFSAKIFASIGYNKKQEKEFLITI